MTTRSYEFKLVDCCVDTEAGTRVSFDLKLYAYRDTAVYWEFRRVVYPTLIPEPKNFHLCRSIKRHSVSWQAVLDMFEREDGLKASQRAARGHDDHGAADSHLRRDGQSRLGRCW